MLIDSHCHINFNAYREDADEVISRSLDNNIWIINIGSQWSTSVRTVKIAEKYEKGVYAVVGLHPIHLNDDITESVMIDGVKHEITTRREEFNYNKYRELAQSSKKVVGLGEVGLDYYYFKESINIEEHKKIQKDVFKKFIEMGAELDLPLVVHCRGTKEDPYGAYDDILEIVKRSDKKIKGVVHCFGGNIKQAREFIDLGFYIGFTGIVTFSKKAEEIQEIAKAIPLDRILVETDAPFLSPEPYRGKRNEPMYVKFVAEKIASLRGISVEDIEMATVENTKKFFNLK